VQLFPSDGGSEVLTGVRCLPPSRLVRRCYPGMELCTDFTRAVGEVIAQDAYGFCIRGYRISDQIDQGYAIAREDVVALP
jgi:hypothetical protein